MLYELQTLILSHHCILMHTAIFKIKSVNYSLKTTTGQRLKFVYKKVYILFCFLLCDCQKITPRGGVSNQPDLAKQETHEKGKDNFSNTWPWKSRLYPMPHHSIRNMSGRLPCWIIERDWQRIDMKGTEEGTWIDWEKPHDIRRITLTKQEGKKWFVNCESRTVEMLQ